MGRLIFIVIATALLVGAAWYWYDRESARSAGMQTEQQSSTDGPSLVTTVRYSCDGGRSIGAAYYEGEEMSPLAPGEPPHPSGSVEVSLDGAASTTLGQTISASGIRYANEDESFVFWSKGDEALIMRDNKMDLEYRNCQAVR